MSFGGSFNLFCVGHADDNGGILIAGFSQPLKDQGVAADSFFLDGLLHTAHIGADPVLDSKFPADEKR